MVKMKRVTIICCISNSHILEAYYDRFKERIPKEFSNYQFNGGQLNLPLEPDSSDLEEALDYAKTHNLHTRLFSKVHYTKKEIEDIPYFQMIIPHPLELEGKCASDYGTQYESGCSYCGQGGKLVGDVLIDRKFVKKYKLGLLEPDIYVSQEIKSIIERSKLTGVSFEHDVKNYKGREIPKNYVMNINNILPSMNKTAWIVPSNERQYEKCGHHVLYLQSDLQYSKNKMHGAQDFNYTDEYLNNARLRDIVVSAKVRQVFKENKIYSFFSPITLL
jgi:hypothetical protein